MSPLALVPRLAADRRGGISIIGALSLTSVAGMAGLAMETSHGYAVKVDNQRIADAAALAGGLSLVADFSSGTANAKATDSAKAIARANGVALVDVTAGVTSPDGTKKLVTVRVDTDVPLTLTRVITEALSFNVVATGKALVTPGASSSTTTTHPNTSACFLALDTAIGTSWGVNVSGASTILATTTGTNGCDVQAVRGIVTNGSASIQARNIQTGTTVNPGTGAQVGGNILIDGAAYFRAAEVDAGGTLTKPGWNQSAIVTSPTANNWFSSKPIPVSDPLATGAVQTALARVTNTGNYPIPPQPVGLAAPATNTSTADWAYTATTKTPASAPGTLSGSTWTIPKGTYNARNITISGGAATLQFAAGSSVVVQHNMSASGSTAIEVVSDPNCLLTMTNCNTFDVAGAFTVEGGGATSRLGHGTYRFGTATFNRPTTVGTATMHVTGLTTFGPYVHNWGAGAHSFGRVVVTGSGNVTMGDGTFWSTQDVSVGGSARLVLGSGTKTIGANAAGQSVIVDGSTLTNFGQGDITLTGALEIGGSTSVQFGAGGVWIGSRRAGNNTICNTVTYDATCRSVYLSGSSNLTFANGTFRTTGGIETGGSSNLTFGSTANHFIRGNLMLNGGVVFGSGAYTVYGSFTKTASMGASGSNLSFFLFGPIELSGSAGSTFAAPTSTVATSDALADILFASLTTGSSIYSGSSQNTYTGAVYVPNSPFTISGSGRIASSGCFALIAKTITVTGSGSGGSKCPGIAAAGAVTTTTSTAPTVALIR